MLRRTKNGFLSHFGGSKQHEVQYTDKEVLSMRKRIMNGETYKSVGDRWSMRGSSVRSLIYRRFPLTEEEEIIRKENKKKCIV